MSTLPPPGPPDPGESGPLSRRDERILAEIENDLAKSDPALSELTRSLLPAASRARRRPQGRADRVLQICVVLVLAVAVLPTQALMLLVLFGVLVGVPVVVLVLEARQRRHGDNGPGEHERKG